MQAIVGNDAEVIGCEEKKSVNEVLNRCDSDSLVKFIAEEFTRNSKGEVN